MELGLEEEAGNFIGVSGEAEVAGERAGRKQIAAQGPLETPPLGRPGPPSIPSSGPTLGLLEPNGGGGGGRTGNPGGQGGAPLALPLLQPSTFTQEPILLSESPS